MTKMMTSTMMTRRTTSSTSDLAAPMTENDLLIEARRLVDIVLEEYRTYVPAIRLARVVHRQIEAIFPIADESERLAAVGQLMAMCNELRTVLKERT